MNADLTRVLAQLGLSAGRPEHVELAQRSLAADLRALRTGAMVYTRASKMRRILLASDIVPTTLLSDDTIDI